MNKKKVIFYSLFSVILYFAESIIPYPVPGVKIGLSNSVTLLILWKDNLKTALFVFLIRVLATSIYFGSLFGPSFMLSFSGGIMSLVVMWLLFFSADRIKKNIFSIYGISIIGAVVHNLTQYFIVNRIFFRIPELKYYIPILLISGVIAGIITAKITFYISGLEILKKYEN